MDTSPNVAASHASPPDRGDGAAALAEMELIFFKVSPIHGIGGFAGATIRRGTRIIDYRGEKIDKKEALLRCGGCNPYIFALDEEWDLDGNVEWNPARFLNHSCAPNCAAEMTAGRIWIVAKRDISPGEEITFNYGYDLEDYKDYPCRCGSPLCVGYIVAEEFFDHLRRFDKTGLSGNTQV